MLTARNCPARDRSYSLANVFSRLRRSVDNAEYSGEENEVTLDLEEQVRPIQSPRTNERQETPENENSEAQEKGNHYASVSSKPQEEEHLPDDMESDKTELTERLETLERTVSDVSNTVASLQKSLETLRKKVGPMSGGIQDFSKGLTFVRGGHYSLSDQQNM